MIDSPVPPTLANALAILSNATVAFLYCITGAYAVLLGAADALGMDDKAIESWTFAAYGLGGLLTLVYSYAYRQPIGIGWSVLGAAYFYSLEDLSITLSELVGAMVVAAGLMLLLSITGVFERYLRYVPEGVVAATLLGLFAPIVLQGLRAAHGDRPALLVALIGISSLAIPPLRRSVGMLVPVAAASALVLLSPAVISQPSNGRTFVSLSFAMPSFEVAALADIVPVMIMSAVLVHTAQGLAILRQEGYAPHERPLLIGCSLAAFPMGALGSVTTCVMGPSVAMLNAAGPHRLRYMGGMIFGAMLLGFGLFAPKMASYASAIPIELIAVLAALAVLPASLAATGQLFRTKDRLPGFATLVLLVFEVDIAGLGVFVTAVLGGLSITFAFSRLRQKLPLRRG